MQDNWKVNFFRLALPVLLILSLSLIHRSGLGKTVLEAEELTVTPEKTVGRGSVLLRGSNWILETPYLEIIRQDRGRKIAARGSVTLTSAEFSVSAKSLSGELTGNNPAELSNLRLDGASGGFEGLSFAGEQAVLHPEKTKIGRLIVEGSARLRLSGRAKLTGDRITLTAVDKGWNVKVEGDSKYTDSSNELSGKEIRLKLASNSRSEGFGPISTEVKSFEAKVSLNEADGKTEPATIRGKEGSFTFVPASDSSRVNCKEASFSTCSCSGGDENCAYAIEAGEIDIKETIIVARSAKLKSFGFPISWAPVYFLPLEEVGLPDRPYFPRIGYSSSNGISLSGAVPIYFNPEGFGNIVFDFLSRKPELGFGLDYYSGRKEVSGIAEIYGTTGNYFKAEGDFLARPTDWLSVKGKADYKQGDWLGKTFDRNEWEIKLSGTKSDSSWDLSVSREESAETNGEGNDGVTHVLERLPELSLSGGNRFEKLDLRTGINSELGYYRENKSDWSSGRRTGFATDLGGSIIAERTPEKFLTLSLRGQGRLNQYYVPEGSDLTTRLWEEVKPGLKLTGPATFRAEFIHRRKTETSPFFFDRVEELDRLRFDLRADQGGFNHSLDFYFDFTPESEFSDLTYKLGYGDERLEGEFTLKQDIAAGSPEKVEADISYHPDNLALDLSTGYDFSSGSVSKTNFGILFQDRRADLHFGLEGTPFRNWLEKLTLETNFRVFENWEIELSGSYELGSGSISDLSYSIKNTLQDCLRVGITGDLTGIGFGVELPGF